MKVIKGRTTFEFTDKEIETLHACYNIFDEIYGRMEENETFCGYSDSNLEDDILSLFSEMLEKLTPNGIITCN